MWEGINAVYKTNKDECQFTNVELQVFQSFQQNNLLNLWIQNFALTINKIRKKKKKYT